MKRRSSGSADDGDESSLDSDVPDPDPNSKTRISPARARRPSSLNWKPSNDRNGRNGQPREEPRQTTALKPTSLAAPSTPDMALARTPTQSPSPNRRIPRPRFSIVVLLISALGIVILISILRSLVTSQLDPKGCRMSYMRPSYVRFTEFDTEHTRFATKYSLYLYREQGIEPPDKLLGIPVLFIPGNAGSYKQVRPIAAEAANYFHNSLQHDHGTLDAGVRSLDFFTVDFNEDITAFHGQTLLDQAEYLNEAVRYILSLYSDPQRATRGGHLPDPTSVIVLGHSMGGVVARAMLVQPNYQTNSINTIITMSAPHARPPVTFDGQIVQIYDEINDYWRQAYSQKWANNNPLWHVTLVSIAGGGLDTVVPSDYASLESLVPPTHGFTVFTTGIPTVWTSMDHQAILWCDQFRKVITKTLYDIVDVHRGSQTKPRADRMKTFKKRFLTGMEPTMEKDLPLKEATTLLTLSDDSNSILPAGQRLVLSQIGQQPKPRAHLLPIPPQGSPEVRRFTVLTDAALDEAGENGKLEVLFCSVFPFQSGQATSLYPFQIDLSTDDGGSTRLACKNAASDRILLPASTASSRYPFYLDREREIVPFSYLQYDLDQLPDHQFVAIIEKSVSSTRSFLIAEFSDQSAFSKKEDTSLAKLLLSGITVDLPANRPLTTEVNIASLQSALLAYKLEITSPHCQAEKALFSPLVRQYLDRPYESKYFVNAQSVDVSLHGVAPYLPPSLESGAEKGVSFQVWTDPSCGSNIHLQIKPDFWGSLGKLYMRYRTVFAAFPMLTVALVLRKQFRVYDSSGVFISFSQSLDLCLRQSIPLLLVSLTLLSMSMEGVPATWFGRWWFQAPAAPLSIDFHRHDILIGTDDPFFWFLVPLIGVVCIGVCAMVHYVTKVFTHVLGVLYWALTLLSLSSGVEEDGVARTPAFVPSTPKRRMITTAILLFLVWTFIPYQFAYLVACLVQLFTVIRALRINENAPSDANSNYYHYAHSVLLLMLWILPINLPILAVWIRNLAVHWLTPFSSHHNVLSIMPFILLVENLTTGKMVPQVGRLFGYVTSLLLFATALYAAMYGISHAYMLHYLVNIIAAWLVVLHSTKDPFSLSGLGAIFESSPTEEHKKSKTSL
ncbi:putative sphingosine-1-phosphate lyase [Fusarium proliferatum ET1]|uniref:GPI inositol-deacylase n=1 Tax=Fusarium proliferatum (strain ET1) TaxID=1227346 RepID=A0A1L7W1B3_FUSPR|nr:putative sphingosine-1-phosphate lyase [Fusarium proliferatum ET1]CZR46455.1 probable sphingosine-1-phosphate lyase [Fusarium proliferatum ET1]